MQVAVVDRVVVDDRDGADAGGGEGRQDRAPESSGSDHDDVRAGEAPLGVAPEPGEHALAGEPRGIRVDGHVSILADSGFACRPPGYIGDVARLRILFAAAAAPLSCSPAVPPPMVQRERGRAPRSRIPSTGTITVFAAASLTEVFGVLETGFEQQHPSADVVLNFGGSGALATQITEGAPADVFAAASEAPMTTVTDAGDAADAIIFTTNTLEIAVPAGNPAGVEGLADIADPALTIALCDPSVPCGAAAETLMLAAGRGRRPTPSRRTSRRCSPRSSSVRPTPAWSM